MMDHGVSSEISALEAAVENLTRAKQSGLSGRELERLQKTVCQETGALCSRYEESVQWAGELEAATFGVVEAALRKGQAAVAGGKRDITQAVEKQIEEFEKFSQVYLRTIPA